MLAHGILTTIRKITLLIQNVLKSTDIIIHNYMHGN
jgi:hypothetical protein